MREGLSKSSGHFTIFKANPTSKLRQKHWDFDKKEYIDDGPFKFAWCKLCNRWAWGQQSICPNRTIKVPVTAEIMV